MHSKPKYWVWPNKFSWGFAPRPTHLICPRQAATQYIRNFPNFALLASMSRKRPASTCCPGARPHSWLPCFQACYNSKEGRTTKWKHLQWLILMFDDDGDDAQHIKGLEWRQKITRITAPNALSSLNFSMNTKDRSTLDIKVSNNETAIFFRVWYPVSKVVKKQMIKNVFKMA